MKTKQLSLNAIFFLIFLINVKGQEYKPCTSRDIVKEFMPDSSVIHFDLKTETIYSSYFSWNKSLELRPEIKEFESENPADNGNTVFDCIGCLPNNILYHRGKDETYTGELLFTQDIFGIKDLPYRRIQIVNGLKDGYEILYQKDDVCKCYYPEYLIYYKEGKRYKKGIEFQHVLNGLRKRVEISFGYIGKIEGPAKVFHNEADYYHKKPNHKIEKLIYEVNILQASEDYSDYGDDIFCCNNNISSTSIGLSSTFSETSEVKFDGWRKEYYPDNGQLRSEEFWENGRISSRKEYHRNDGDKCKQNQLYLSEDIKIQYLDFDDFIKNETTYFFDCKQSLESKITTRGFTTYIGEYIMYSQPGIILVKGKYNDEGEKEGIWEEYDSTGLPKLKSTYQSGLKHGIEEVYNDTGKIFRILRYENDEVVLVIK